MEPRNQLEKDFALFTPLTRDSLDFLYNVLVIGAMCHTDTGEYMDDYEKRQEEWRLMDESM